MQNYVPTPVALTDIDLPQDVIDDVVVSTVRPAMETTADGVAYCQNRLWTGYARAQVTDGTYDPGDWLGITLVSSTGSPRTAFTTGAHTGGPGGNYIGLGFGDFPAAVGYWRFKVDLVVTTDPAEAIGDISLWAGTSTDPTAGTELTVMTSMRSDPLGRTIISGEYDVRVSSSSDMTKLSLVNSGSNTIIVSNVALGFRKIQIEQLSRE